MQRIYRYRMTTTSGGNLSIREANGDVWITPARVDKGGLRRDDIVLRASRWRSRWVRPPSSELPLHQAIYASTAGCGRDRSRASGRAGGLQPGARGPNTRLFHQSWHVCGEGGFARV